ncbi:MAG: 23S rRNA (adenine(2503)-C(2))-methyltransferase RlmN [Bacteroidales bacterium]|nr:23S rRNA (adenine(2503)-C(2))-methyltransferase RlmN [Bacteroidales bacterium]
MKEKLLGKSPEELKAVAQAAGLPPFAGKQLAQWMYEKRAKSFEEMTNISKSGREKLSEIYDLGTAAPLGVAESKDGTKKYLFPVRCPVGAGHDHVVTPDPIGGLAVEAVMIPDEERKTLCVSSQAGCKMGCKFCMTGRQGFHGNLAPAEILNQFISVDESAELTNAVFMGMGEPLDNTDNVLRAIEVLTAPWGFAWSPKRVTLSTIGVLPNLRRFLDESRCHLAISIHNPFPDERLELMPVQKAWPVAEVVRMLKEYDWTAQRRVSFEYTMFAGWNDDKRHADALVRLLRDIECRVNLIRFHKIPDFPYECASPRAMEAFRDRLNSLGVTTTIRASRGEDILAACGMLAGKHNQ